MSWPMPTGSWNPGVAAMTPDLNMGNYTPEQWAAVQQQNWQQWAQWQQQYAQWQSQYGEKYAQQMQAMGALPPLPLGSAAPPPAPPPPDQPPPPPPHENNQPLFGTTPAQPSPVPPPAPAQRNANSGYNNANFTGNKQNWSYPAADTHTEPSQVAVNSEALKKLAEEERLFDIQFQKWEEEIKKWKLENVNHPDRQAYNEYEAKFEACRMQLLERRQQMNQRKARLLGNVAKPTNSPTPATTGNNKTSTVVPPPQNSNKQSYNPAVPPQNFNMPPPAHYPNQNKAPNQLQYNNKNAPGYNRGNNKINIDPQDRYESYQNIEDYSVPTTSSDKSSFLPASGSGKGIPGLDLVPEAEKPPLDVIDITEDQGNQQRLQPDYSKISKGINNILGDEKIMNILSMVRGQCAPHENTQNAQMNAHGGPMGPSATAPYNMGGPYNTNMNSQNIPPPNRNDNQYNNQQYDNRQGMPYNRQGPYPMDQNQQNRDYDQGQEDMPQNQYNDRNAQYGGPNMGPRGGQFRPNAPAPRPLLEIPVQHNIIDNMQRRPHGNRGGMQGSDMHDDGGMHDNRGMHDRGMPENNMPINQPPRQKWVEDPLFTPSIIVEYEHKPLRLKARDFIEPVHMFDYDHKSKDEEYKRKDFESEADELFTRKPRRPEIDTGYDRSRQDRYARDHTRVFERRVREEPREDFHPRDEYRSREDYRPRDDYHSRIPPKEEYDDRRRNDSIYFDRRRDDREKYVRRDDNMRERERERDRYRDSRREETRRSRSRDKDSRKRGRSRESEISDTSKKSKETEVKARAETPKHVVMIDDLLEPPGRDMRPEKIVIILRGPPGSGKSYLAKLIRDREAEYGGAARIMSIDDYFMQEGDIEEKDPATGKIIKKPTLKYEYDEKLEEAYINSLKRAFKRSLTDGYFSFLIYDAVNDQLKGYADIWNFARQNGFQAYVCTMDLDPQTCYKRNIHNRTLEDIEVICTRFFKTPAHHIQLDATTLLQNAAIPDVHMEDAIDDVIMEDVIEVETTFTSKWEKMDDAAQLARLDGTSKPLRPSQLSMEDYLQLDDWKPTQAKPGKKTVRWADIEERREQEKMRAIGFVVGQTDWNRMTDPTMGSSALTQTKYIERVRRD